MNRQHSYSIYGILFICCPTGVGTAVLRAESIYPQAALSCHGESGIEISEMFRTRISVWTCNMETT